MYCDMCKAYKRDLCICKPSAIKFVLRFKGEGLIFESKSKLKKAINYLENNSIDFTLVLRY